MSVKEIFENNKDKPLLCLEVNPPRGTDLAPILERLESKLGGIDFLNITDSALARMKLAALPFAGILRQKLGIETVVNMSCRDRNVIALQSDLLAAWVNGVNSIVALTGDALSVGDFPEGKGVFEVNSIGLLNIIASINSCKDMAGNKLNGAPDYFPGVVVNPNVKNPAAELRRLQKKKDAGARYALSQPVFDLESSYNFFKEAESVGVDLFIGLLPFKTGKSALGITNVPGIKVPEAILERARANPDEDLSEYSIEHCMQLAIKNKDHVRGFHVISGATPKLGLELSARLANYIAGL